jgi:hypothetical protein
VNRRELPQLLVQLTLVMVLVEHADELARLIRRSTWLLRNEPELLLHFCLLDGPDT